jgi:hypothetical protein
MKQALSEKMKRKFTRPNKFTETIKELNTQRLTEHQAQEIIERRGLPKSVVNAIKWKQHSPSYLTNALKLDSKFLTSLTSETKILELGAGTGRLTNWILNNSKIKPENYTILDLVYSNTKPSMKKKIALLIKKGKIKPIQEQILQHEYPKNHYNHIFLPESFFPEFLAPEHIKSYEFKSGVRKQNARIFEMLIKKLNPALKKGGTIRLSSKINIGHMVWGIKKEIKELNLQGYNISFTNTGVILKKK